MMKIPRTVIAAVALCISPIIASPQPQSVATEQKSKLEAILQDTLQFGKLASELDVTHDFVFGTYERPTIVGAPSRQYIVLANRDNDHFHQIGFIGEQMTVDVREVHDQKRLISSYKTIQPKLESIDFDANVYALIRKTNNLVVVESALKIINHKDDTNSNSEYYLVPKNDLWNFQERIPNFSFDFSRPYLWFTYKNTLLGNAPNYKKGKLIEINPIFAGTRTANSSRMQN